MYKCAYNCVFLYASVCVEFVLGHWKEIIRERWIWVFYDVSILYFCEIYKAKQLVMGELMNSCYEKAQHISIKTSAESFLVTSGEIVLVG